MLRTASSDVCLRDRMKMSQEFTLDYCVKVAAYFVFTEIYVQCQSVLVCSILILFIQALALYKSFTYLLTYLLRRHSSLLYIVFHSVLLSYQSFSRSSSDYHVFRTKNLQDVAYIGAAVFISFSACADVDE